jgi:L-fuconolactonase
MRIDAHQHFWKYSAAEYPWIPAGSALHRDWLPEDLETIQRPLGLDGSVAVQARQSLEETRWLLALAERFPRILGVVGWVDLRSDELDGQLDAFVRNPRFVGVRHVVQDEPDGFLTGEGVLAGLRRLAERGVCYDVLVFARQMPDVLRMMDAVDGLRMVIDHGAKPDIRGGGFDEWRRLLGEVAARPGVFCKLSGLVTEADWTAWSVEGLEPYLEAIFEVFGPERVMWGSDWPVCLHAASYAEWWGVATGYVSKRCPEFADVVFGGNCATFYRLGWGGCGPV